MYPYYNNFMIILWTLFPELQNDKPHIVPRGMRGHRVTIRIYIYIYMYYYDLSHKIDGIVFKNVWPTNELLPPIVLYLRYKRYII
jgi:hypothetical protein